MKTMMDNQKSNTFIGIWIIAGITILFGLLSIISGVSILFIGGTFREDAGNYVPFVLWFNFFAGFAYIAAGVGLWVRKRWAVWISIFIVVSSLVIFTLLGIYIFNGGVYETRTIVAMSFRTLAWALIALFAYRKIILS